MPKVKIIGLPSNSGKANNGKRISSISENMFSSPIIEFNGPSHDNGGIDIKYGETGVEVEGGETGFIDNQKDLNIFGNMIVPGTNKKFKTVSKTLANKEKKIAKLTDNGVELVNERDPHDQWDSLAFNSGKAMMIGGAQKQKELTQSKEHLANIQNAMLQHAEELGVNPQKYSEGKAKYGKKIAASGDELYNSILKRKRPSYGVKNVLYNYGNADENALRSPLLPVTVKNKPRVKFGQAPIIPTSRQLLINQGIMGNANSLQEKNFLPMPPKEPSYQDYLKDNIHMDKQGTKSYMGTNAEPLELAQILPELYGIATNKVEPVAMQKYTPELYSPYNVSFQDRYNRNNATFKGLEQAVGNNPAALSTLAGQTYAANNDVAAEEFRTNQGVAEDIKNKNIGLLNDAQNRNLILNDNQYVRQQTAKSKTKEQTNVILNSISNKMLQSEAANRQLKVYENLYDYRFDKGTEQAKYKGPDAVFNWDSAQLIDTQDGPDGQLTTYKDKYGNIKSSKEVVPSERQRQKEDLKLIDLNNTINKYPKNLIPPKFGKGKNGGIVRAFKTRNQSS